MKVRYMATFLCFISLFYGAYAHGTESEFLLRNEYGAVVSEDKNSINGAIVENVILYSQKDANSSKKIERKGILVRYPHARATIIICHGFMCDKFDAGFLRQIFPAGEYNFMTFDFRAHGEDVQGQCCTFGRDEALDVIAAVGFVENHPALKGQKKLAYGFSMGAVSAIEAFKVHALESEIRTGKPGKLFDAMVLDCPFDSSKNVIKHNLDNVKCSFLGYEFNIPGRWILQRYVFHPYVQSLVKLVLKTVAKMDPKNINTYICPVFPAQSVANVCVPCLFIHCKRDEKVSIPAIKSVFFNAGCRYKLLWITNGRGHFDSYLYNPERYARFVALFFKEAVDGLLEDQSCIEIIEDPSPVS